MKKLFTLLLLFSITKIWAQCPWNFTITSQSGSFSLTCYNPNPINVQAINDNTNAVTYFWSGPSYTSAASSVMLAQAGVYTLVVTDAITTCAVTQTFEIFINIFIPYNTVSPTTQSVLCSGSPVSFTGALNNPSINVQFEWYSPLNPLPAGAPMAWSNGTISTLTGSFSPGVYTLVTTNINNGCSSSSTFTITSPDAFPSFNVSSTTGYSIGCAGNSQTTLSIINAVSTETVPAVCSFTFLPPGFAGTLAPGPWNNITSTVTSLAGAWTVCVLDNNNGCQTKLPVSILQSPYTVDFNFSVNPSGLVNFASTSTGTNANTIYNWDFGDATSGSGPATPHTYSNGGVHHVTLTTSNPNCSVTYSVDVNTVPCTADANYSLFPSGTPQLWYAIPSYYGNVTDVLWSWGDLTYDNTLYPSHTYSAAGTHTICLTVTVSCNNSTTSCSSYSVYRSAGSAQSITTVNVLYKMPVGIKVNQDYDEFIEIYPNPGSSVINIKNGTEKSGTISIYNIEGKEIQKMIFEANSPDGVGARIENFEPGIYFVEIKIEKSIIRKKVIVLR